MGFRSLEDSRKFRERKGGRKGRNITAHIKDNKKMSLMRIQHSHFPLLNHDTQGLTTSPLSAHCKMKARFIKAHIKDEDNKKMSLMKIQHSHFLLLNRDTQGLTTGPVSAHCKMKARFIKAHIKDEDDKNEDDKIMSLMRVQHSHFPLLNRNAQGLTTSPLSTHCKMKARFIKACIKGAMDSAAIKEAKCMIQCPFSLPNQDAQATAVLLKDCCEIAIIK